MSDEEVSKVIESDSAEIDIISFINICDTTVRVKKTSEKQCFAVKTELRERSDKSKRIKRTTTVVNDVKSESDYDDIIDDEKVTADRAVLLRSELLLSLLDNDISQNESYDEAYDEALERLSDEEVDRVRNDYR